MVTGATFDITPFRALYYLTPAWLGALGVLALFTEPDAHSPMYMLVDQALVRKKTADPTGPADMQVKYVRAYAK